MRLRWQRVAFPGILVGAYGRELTNHGSRWLVASCDKGSQFDSHFENMRLLSEASELLRYLVNGFPYRNPD